MANHEFVYNLHIAATAEKVWQALTEGEFTREYWASNRIESDWKVGSPVVMYRESGKVDWRGEVIEFDPPRRMSYTFYDPETEEEATASRATLEIRDSGPGTVLLTVTHTGLTEEGCRSVGMGWPAILSCLKSVLETSKPLAFNWKCGGV